MSVLQGSGLHATHSSQPRAAGSIAAHAGSVLWYSVLWPPSRPRARHGWGGWGELVRVWGPLKDCRAQTRPFFYYNRRSRGQPWLEGSDLLVERPPRPEGPTEERCAQGLQGCSSGCPGCPEEAARPGRCQRAVLPVGPQLTHFLWLVSFSFLKSPVLTSSRGTDF